MSITALTIGRDTYYDVKLTAADIHHKLYFFSKTFLKFNLELNLNNNTNQKKLTKYLVKIPRKAILDKH